MLGSAQVEDIFKLKSKISTTTTTTTTTTKKKISPHNIQTLRVTSSQLSATISSSRSASDVSDEEVNRLQRKIAKRVKSFQPRVSQLDRETMENNEHQFRGFFTFFWIAMGFYLMNTGIQNFQTIGKFVDLSFFRLFTKDFLVLMISDACMVGSMFFVVILQKLISIGWIRWRYTGMIIQHIFQVIFLFVPIYWSFFRGWPWVQSGFFLLHTISMLMKLHSYSFYNGELSIWKNYLSELKSEYSSLVGSSKKHDREVTTDDDDNDNNDDNDDDESIESKIRQLKETISQVEGYTKSPSEKIQYPNNVTVLNFIDFLLVPTLVYELEYPRTEKIRSWYVFEKILAIFGTFFLLYVNTESYIIPVLPNASTSVWKAIVNMLFPFMINYLLLFYIIFECICNLFGELTRFADRNFYDDWWNSVTFEEFARKWNKPVHHFLLRHVYQQSIDSYKLSKRDATFMTFFLSSLIHELVMVVVAKKIRMYLFFLQMFQLPMIWLGNLKFVRERKWLGNAFFWFSMFVGPPLLGVLYCREVFLN